MDPVSQHCAADGLGAGGVRMGVAPAVVRAAGQRRGRAAAGGNPHVRVSWAGRRQAAGWGEGEGVGG